jgi:hypothetical protein
LNLVDVENYEIENPKKCDSHISVTNLNLSNPCVKEEWRMGYGSCCYNVATNTRTSACGSSLHERDDEKCEVKKRKDRGNP